MPAIAEFARYLTGSARQLDFAALAGVMPTTRSGLRQTLIRVAANSNDPAQQAVIEAARSMQNARSLYVSGIEDYDELRRVLVQATEAAITGRKPVKPALEEAARIWNRKLAAQKGGH
jgi:putative chitobiose transport system substrate-binding protein